MGWIMGINAKGRFILDGILDPESSDQTVYKMVDGRNRSRAFKRSETVMKSVKIVDNWMIKQSFPGIKKGKARLPQPLPMILLCRGNRGQNGSRRVVPVIGRSCPGVVHSRDRIFR